MDFSCDRCGRRYFVPDELVQGRVFRAKCDGCDHTFFVAVPHALAAAAQPSAGKAEPAGQALSDEDLAEIADGVGPLVPDWAKPPDSAPLPSLTSWPEPDGTASLPSLAAVPWPEPVEPPLPSLAPVPWPEPTRAAPRSPSAPVSRPEPVAASPSPPAASKPEPALAAPPSSPAAPRPPAEKLPLPPVPAPQAQRAERARGTQEAPRAPASALRPAPAREEPPAPERGPRAATPVSPAVEPRRPGATGARSAALEAPAKAAADAAASAVAEESAEESTEVLAEELAEESAEESREVLAEESAEELAEAPAQKPAEVAAEQPAEELAGAARERPGRRAQAGGLTEEDLIAAGARHRHRWAIAAGAALLGACALGALLVSRLGGPGAAGAPRATTARAGAPAAPGTVPFDASSLAGRGAPGKQTGKGAKAAATRKRRRVAVRLDDRKLLDLLGRKEDVPMEAPPQDVELDSAKDVLDPAAVERTVAASRRAFDACVTKALRLNPSLRVSKRATLIVTVEPDGRVTGGWIAEEKIEGTDLGRCLVTASSRMSFPSFQGEAIDVSIPLSLSSVY